MTPIPLERWSPLSLAETVALFQNSPFTWMLAGGYAIEQFVGRQFRPHGDIDILIFRDEQLAAQRWLLDWSLYAADPPGHLRPWLKDEYLPVGIHDIWGHPTGGDAWRLQLMLAEVDGERWTSRPDKRIGGRRDDLMTVYNGLPCLRVEVQLFYKGRKPRPKDELDFEMCLPMLSPDAKRWLRDALLLMFPQGTTWTERLSEA